jgi:hypothetical protein
MVTLRIFAPLALAGALAAPPAFAEESRLEERPVPAPDSAEDQGWGVRVDDTYDALAGRVESTARWIDGFFGAERAELESNFSYLRLTPRLGWDDDDGFTPDAQIRGKIDLPSGRRRFALLIAGQQDRDALRVADADQEQLILDDRDDADGRIGLQWIFDEDSRTHASVNGTFTSGGNPELSLRVRRLLRPEAEDFYGFFSARPYWHFDDGFGVRFNGQLNRSLGERTLLRVSSSIDTWEEREGWEWEAGALLFRRLESRAVVAFSLQVEGESDPEWKAGTWTAGPLYRRSIFRDWIFVTLQPFVRWRTPRLDDTTRAHGVLVELDFIVGQRQRDADGAG